MEVTDTTLILKTSYCNSNFIAITKRVMCAILRKALTRSWSGWFSFRCVSLWLSVSSLQWVALYPFHNIDNMMLCSNTNCAEWLCESMYALFLMKTVAENWSCTNLIVFSTCRFVAQWSSLQWVVTYPHINDIYNSDTNITEWLKTLQHHNFKYSKLQ